MRIPFDLIAVILCAERIFDYLKREDADLQLPGAARMLWVWSAFLFGSWLLHEIAARLTEIRTDYGRRPSGGAGIHPLQFHTRLTIIAQVLTVALCAAAFWYLKWPLAVLEWPTWFGLADDASFLGMPLAQSNVAATLLTVGPYLAAMVLSWIPRRRLASGTRRRMIPLFSYLSFEAKMTWMPLGLFAVMAVLSDVAQMVPNDLTSWLKDRWIQTALILGFVVVGVTIVVPVLLVKMWGCAPLPEGELKQRLLKLMERSGVKARAILVWGTRSSGMLNACVLGPWSRFRYVLISPALADELSIEETEAVLAHELGHARYGHLTFYFCVLLCMAMLVEPLTNAMANGWSAFPILQAGATMAFVIGYMYYFFGALSRQCEREADLASAELIGTPAPLIAALEKIATRAGDTRGVPCWHHGSIADRVSAVLRLSGDPGESVRFHARLKAIRIGLMAFAAVLLAAQLIFRS